MTDWVEGTVQRKHLWTDKLCSLHIDAPVEPFRAGQFTTLALDIEGERVARPYSYVNAPEERPLEFYFVTVPDGPLTRRMIAFRPGDRVFVASRPRGVFTLDQVPDATDLWLLCTGTALGVFLSILKTSEPWQRFSRVILVHGVRQAEELTYRDTLRQLGAQHSHRLQSVSFVSRERSELALPGRITDAIEDGRLEAEVSAPLSAAHAQVMVCGNPHMVRDTMLLLERRGLKRNTRRTPGHITTENYW